MNTEMAEISAQITQLIQQLKEDLEIAGSNYNKRNIELRRICDEMHRTDELRLKLESIEKEKYQQFEDAIEQSYPPGTVISYNNDYYVVDGVNRDGKYSYLKCWPVSNPPSRAKKPINIPWNTAIVLHSLYDIMDSKLRRNAEKLIARARLKDW